MNRNVIVIGAGMGGLTAAIRLARQGHRVRVLEARPEAGGLASRMELDGLTFDAGPYVLFDRPGLEWAFQTLGLELDEHVALRRIEGEVYRVAAEGGPPVCIFDSPEETSAALERSWPGSGRRYLGFVESTARAYERLQPLQRTSRPGLLDLVRTGAWRSAPFLLRPLSSILSGTALPFPVTQALGIWTQVAGQRIERAPGPLAFVPALIHRFGAWFAGGGIGSIPQTLAAVAASAGVEFRYETKVRRIRREAGRIAGVETERGETLAADAVVANSGGVGTYLDLLDSTPPRVRERLAKLPLQSPGVCAYLAVKAGTEPPYLRFHLPDNGELCRLLVRPSVLCLELQRGRWRPARLLAPMDHRAAETGGPAGQREFLDRILAETWWREHVGEYRVLATRIPAEWGGRFHLHRDSMNPVMTARFMRAGRIAHRSPHVRGLYLAGSATHPGQWVSFCAISGILAADCLQEDFG